MDAQRLQELMGSFPQNSSYCFQDKAGNITPTQFQFNFRKNGINKDSGYLCLSDLIPQ